MRDAGDRASVMQCEQIGSWRLRRNRCGSRGGGEIGSGPWLLGGYRLSSLLVSSALELPGSSRSPCSCCLCFVDGGQTVSLWFTEAVVCMLTPYVRPLVGSVLLSFTKAFCLYKKKIVTG